MFFVVVFFWGGLLVLFLYLFVVVFFFVVFFFALFVWLVSKQCERSGQRSPCVPPREINLHCQSTCPVTQFQIKDLTQNDSEVCHRNA